MNEININIEGYNVNGICVGCLNYNRKMFYSIYVKECFRILGNIDVPDGLTIQVCWQCLAEISRIWKFQQLIQKSYYHLIEYSRQHTFLDSPNDLSKYATQRLNTTQVDIYTLEPNEDSNKDLLEIEVPLKTLAVDVVKEEYEDVDIKYDDDDTAMDNDIDMEFSTSVDIKDDIVNYDDATVNSQDSDDEDVQLSKLKRKKERREKKKHKYGRKKKKSLQSVDGKERKALQLKNYRKLKNLPEEIVELVDTMSEEKMWEMRRGDVANPDFVKLKYKCNDCVIGFNTLKLMNDHMNGKHNPKNKNSHQCDICKSYLLTKDNLSVHRGLHLVGYNCKLCGFRTTLKRLMLRHIADYHKEKENCEDYECSLCKKMFDTKSKLSYHKGICHQERPQCDCCGKVFANKMTLKYHLKILPNVKTESKEKNSLYLPCKGCDKVFHSKKSYRAHVVIHDGVEYPCPVCGKLFQWKRNLARHLRNHAERDTGTYYECKPCRKRFSSKDCFNNHMKFSKMHVSEESFTHECNYCGKKFPTKWCMVDHIDWDHLKIIKYQCLICLKAFKTAKIMVAHMNNIHEGKKNREPEGEHLCDICGKSYKTVKRLKGHVWAMHTHRSHSKSYKCKLCPATFTWQTSIYKHVKMMHDSKRLKTSRPTQPAKKARTESNPYDGLELTNRMPYFQHNVPNNLVLHVQNTTAGLTSNIV